MQHGCSTEEVRNAYVLKLSVRKPEDKRLDLKESCHLEHTGIGER